VTNVAHALAAAQLSQAGVQGFAQRSFVMESSLAWPSAVAPGVLAETAGGAQLLGLWRL